jgi:ribonuclease HII
MMVCLFGIAIALAIYVVAISTTMSQIQARNYQIETVDQIAIRSQFEVPYTSTMICADSRLKPIFDASIFAKDKNFEYF